MPLLKGSDKNIIAENIKEMRRRGHPEAQAVAASMRMAKGKGKSIKAPKKFPKVGASSFQKSYSATDDHDYEE